MTRRTPQREMQAWKRRLEQLARKEARCPACAKAKKLNEGTVNAPVCEAHMRVRQQMVWG